MDLHFYHKLYRDIYFLEHVEVMQKDGQFFLKVLIPSYAAGSIIGKGGQTIVQLQKETGATIKLSKSKDFYPGEVVGFSRLQLLRIWGR
ncbi:hypothetical protein FKM82_021602 [Ascaphus truei]